METNEEVSVLDSIEIFVNESTTLSSQAHTCIPGIGSRARAGLNYRKFLVRRQRDWTCIQISFSDETYDMYLNRRSPNVCAYLELHALRDDNR